MIKGIIFDLDETLYDFSAPDSIAVDAVGNHLLERGLVKSKDVFRIAYKEVVSQLFSESDQPYIYDRVVRMQRTLDFLGIINNALSEELANLYWKVFYSSIRIWPDLHPTFEWLDSRFRIGVLTDGLRKWQWEKIKILHLTNYIDVFVTAEDLGFSKPRKECFLETANRLHLPPNEVVMVGDLYDKDVLGALSAGMHAVFFKRRDNEDNYGRSEIPIIKRLHELRHLMILR
ncbi:MAG: HAD-IA family hydrolase [Candidatus Korarchaeota archaeon]